MLVLGIETATSVCGVALTDDGGLIAESRLVGPNLHNERLHGMMRALLAQCCVKPEKLQAVAVSIGPGSFTGLRIGLAAAKGLVLALELKLVGVSTLEALAEQASPTAKSVCAIIPAKPKFFYLGRFRRYRGGIKAQGAPELVEEAFLHEAVPRGAVLLGPGCSTLEPAVLLRLRERVHVDDSLRGVPSAATVAVLGHRMLMAGHSDDPATLEPAYFQEFVAAKPKPVAFLEKRT